MNPTYYPVLFISLFSFILLNYKKFGDISLESFQKAGIVTFPYLLLVIMLKINRRIPLNLMASDAMTFAVFVSIVILENLKFLKDASYIKRVVIAGFALFMLVLSLIVLYQDFTMPTSLRL
jgi:hypothetical protein